MSGPRPTQDFVFRQTQEMFPQLEPEVIYIILSENDFNIANSLDQLSILCSSTSDNSPPKAENVNNQPNQPESTTDTKKFEETGSASLFTPSIPAQSATQPPKPTHQLSQSTVPPTTKAGSRRARRKAAKQKLAAKKSIVQKTTKNNFTTDSRNGTSERKHTEQTSTGMIGEITVQTVANDVPDIEPSKDISLPLNWDEEPTAKEIAPALEITTESSEKLEPETVDNNQLSFDQPEPSVVSMKKIEQSAEQKRKMHFIIVHSYVGVGKWNGMRLQFSGEGQRQPFLVNGVNNMEHPSIKFKKKEKAVSKSPDIKTNCSRPCAVSSESVQVAALQQKSEQIEPENRELFSSIETVLSRKDDPTNIDDFLRLKSKLNELDNSGETMRRNTRAWDFPNSPPTGSPYIRQPRTPNNGYRGLHPQDPGMGMGLRQRFYGPRHPFQQPHGFNTPPRLQRVSDGLSRKQRKELGPPNRKRILYILRGAPGSGKSTLAQMLAGSRGRILSTDDFFIRPNGFYVFDPTLLQHAHLWNQERARNLLHKGHTPVVIDNTNMTAWEMTPYVLEGAKNNYNIQIKEPDTWWRNKAGQLAKRNSHGVPKETIIAMLGRYEKNVTVQSILNSAKEKQHANQLTAAVNMAEQTAIFHKNLDETTSSLAETKGKTTPPWEAQCETDDSLSQQNQDCVDLLLDNENTSSSSESDGEEINDNRSENVTNMESNATDNIADVVMTSHHPSNTFAETYLSSDNSSISDDLADETNNFDNEDETDLKMSDTETPEILEFDSQASTFVDKVLDNVSNSNAVLESKITPEFEELANTLDSLSQFDTKPDVELDTIPVVDNLSVNKSPKKSKKRPSKKQQESLLQDIHFDSDWGDFLNSIKTTNEVAPVESNNRPQRLVEMKDKYAWTDPDDFIKLRQFEHGDYIESTEGFKFIFANSYSFIPISLSDVETPDSVLDKSTSTNEYEMKHRDPNDDLRTLQVLFSNLSSEHLRYVYTKCGEDLHWATDIIAESSLFGTDEDELLGSESRTSPIVTRSSPQTIDDYYNRVSFNDSQEPTISTTLEETPDSTQNIPAVSIHLPMEFLQQVASFAGEDLPKINTQVVEIEMDAALNLYLAWKKANSSQKETSNVNGPISMFNSSDMPNNSLKLSNILSDESEIDVQQIEEDEKLARRLQMEEAHGLQAYKKPNDDARFSATPPRYSQPLVGVSNQSLWSPRIQSSPSTLSGDNGQWSLGRKQQSEPFSQIMQEEKAAEASQKKQRASANDMKLAAQMKRDQLKIMYPKIPEDLLNDMFQKNDFNMEETMYTIACIWPNDDSSIFNTVTTTGSLLPSVEQSSDAGADLTDKTDVDESELISACMGNRTLSYQELRAEANIHRKEMHECHRKAAAANHQSKGALAMYYASQAQLHKKYLREANNRAAELTYKQMNEGRAKDELDLHGLHVDEAIDTLRSVIARKRAENESRHLFVITGWGKNSATGTSKIRSAVTEWLNQTGITFAKVNEGYLKINL